MTKADLIEAVAARAKITNRAAEDVVNTTFHAMRAAVLRGERIELRGFGSFEVKHYGSYTGRNPRTGKPVEVKPKRLPVFKAGKALRERLCKP